ncbi:hypothetical protein SeMB42_g01018 [Synchytrium endobioticum]|uniref:Uncharacterized protein n=1 Tax=Synchytrium endobioticum TaxID=286115 RepID=A0A507DQ70_9FUNG|nr:hypothetical protein SeMB42_g01018 [Synchytrium endobioticum]
MHGDETAEPANSLMEIVEARMQSFEEVLNHRLSLVMEQHLQDFKQLEARCLGLERHIRKKLSIQIAELQLNQEANKDSASSLKPLKIKTQPPSKSPAPYPSRPSDNQKHDDHQTYPDLEENTGKLAGADSLISVNPWLMSLLTLWDLFQNTILRVAASKDPFPDEVAADEEYRLASRLVFDGDDKRYLNVLSQSQIKQLRNILPNWRSSIKKRLHNDLTYISGCTRDQDLHDLCQYILREKSDWYEVDNGIKTPMRSPILARALQIAFRMTKGKQRQYTSHWEWKSYPMASIALVRTLLHFTLADPNINVRPAHDRARHLYEKALKQLQRHRDAKPQVYREALDYLWEYPKLYPIIKKTEDDESSDSDEGDDMGSIMEKYESNDDGHSIMERGKIGNDDGNHHVEKVLPKAEKDDDDLAICDGGNMQSPTPSLHFIRHQPSAQPPSNTSIRLTDRGKSKKPKLAQPHDQPFKDDDEDDDDEELTIFAKAGFCQNRNKHQNGSASKTREGKAACGSGGHVPGCLSSRSTSKSSNIIRPDSKY